METPFLELKADYFTFSQFNTKPIEGYEVPINKKTGEKFPMCCKFHKKIFTDAETWFKKFPNCCDEHKKLNGNPLFKKQDYNGVPLKIVTQLSYTEHLIKNRIDTVKWYKDITDYIDYNTQSFGHPAVGLHMYSIAVKHFLKNTKEFGKSKEKAQRLVEYIEGDNTATAKAEKTDLNILLSTYQKWLKEFPFELNSYFGNLKQHFEKQLPFLNGKAERNIYSGVIKGKLHTKTSLFESLIDLTDNLLTQINGDTLLEKGVISDADKLQFELIRQERKQKIKEGYKNSSPNEEHRYKKMIKDWLRDEQVFWGKVKPVLHKALPHSQDVKRNYVALAFYYYYKQIVGEIQWFDHWQGGREQAYKEVVSEHYTNPAKTAWKQFQREYVKIEQEHSSNRFQLCSKENYPAILELLKESPKGLAKAKEELSKAIT